MKQIINILWNGLLIVLLGYFLFCFADCRDKPVVVPPVVVDTAQLLVWYCTPIAPTLADRAVSMRGKAHPNGTTLRVGFIGGTAAQRQQVKDSYARWTANDAANLKFEFPESGNTNIRVSFNPGSAWSYIGLDCNSIAQTQPTLNFGFGGAATIDHEAGHSLGLLHEMQLAGGVCWNEENVIADMKAQGWTDAMIRFNILDYHNPANIITSGYDKYSIMHYSIPARWTCNNVAIAGGSNISAADKLFVNKTLYPYPLPPAPTTVTITAAQRNNLKRIVGKTKAATDVARVAADSLKIITEQIFGVN